MERRTLAQPVQLIEKREDAPARISGYAAVYYDPTDPGTEYPLWADMYERVMPGAFDRAVREKDDVRALFNHNPSMILGRTKAGTCRLALDAKGLKYEIDVPDTCCGNDLLESLRRGDIDGSSFSFDVDEQRWVDTKMPDGSMREIREIVSVKLYDVAPVTYPAYEATSSSAGAGAGRGTVMGETRSIVEARRADRDIERGKISIDFFRRRLRLIESK